MFYFLCLSCWPARRGLKYSRMHKDVKYGRMNQLVFLRSERVHRRVWQYPRGGILRGLAPPGFMGHFVYAQTGQGCPSIHRRCGRVCARVFVRPRTTPSWILLELDRFDTMFATRWFASPLRLDDFRLYVVWEIFLLRSGNWESLRGNYVSRIWRIVRNDNSFF